MRYRAGAVVVAGMVFFAGIVRGADGQTLSTEKDKTSYAVGAQMGSDMRRYQMNLDPDMVAKGFRHAYQGGKLLLVADQELSRIMAGAEKQMAAKSAELTKQDAQKNIQEGAPFWPETRQWRA